MATRTYTVHIPGYLEPHDVTFRTGQSVKQISGMQYEGKVIALGQRFVTVDIGGRFLSFRPNDLMDMTHAPLPHLPSPD